MRILFLTIPLLVACSAEREASNLEPTEAPDVATVTPEAEATPAPSPTPMEPTPSPTEAPEPTPTATAIPAPTPDPYDVDGDGWMSDAVSPERDCDDEDPLIHPGANELCGTFDDEDCNGLSEYTGTPIDYDADGFPACAYDRFTLTDCRESDRGTYPGAIEYLNDTLDSDCNGRDY